MAIFLLFLTGLECLAVGFKKKGYSVPIVLFMIVNIPVFSNMVSTWNKEWLTAIFVVNSIFVGIFMWQIEKWLFIMFKKVWYKIPQFSDTAQVALMIGLVTPLVTILLKVLG